MGLVAVLFYGFIHSASRVIKIPVSMEKNKKMERAQKRFNIDFAHSNLSLLLTDYKKIKQKTALS